MYDFPTTAKFLNKEEKMEVNRRLAADHNYLADGFSARYVTDALKDWNIWVNCLITVGIFTPLYSVSLFLPTIIEKLGYTNNAAQLMTVPVYAVACVFCIICGFMADRFQQRGIFQIFFTILA
jgi:sugar phosphate permease